MKQSGFSLLEFVLIMALISIVTVFSYPNYQQAIVRARRVEGKTALLHLALHLEHYYTRHHSYEDANVEAFGVHSPWYQFNITFQNQSHFELAAIAQGVQALGDLNCKTLTLTSEGQKGPRTACW